MVSLMKFGILGCAVGAAVAASPLSAQVITFDELGLPHGTFPSTPVGFDTLGFTFSNNADIQDISATSVYAGTGPAVSGDYAALNDYGGVMSITKTGGGLFDLASFYIEGWFGNYGAQTATAYVDGNVVATFDYTIGSGYNVDTGWRQILTNFIGVDKVELTSQGWGVLVDNVDATAHRADNATGAVPEPATWLAMLAGFGIIGLGMRRQIRSQVSFR